VTGGRAVIAGTEDRQHAYVALSQPGGWRLADYLDQHGRRERRELIPPEAFWAATARYTDPGARLVRLLDALHPDDQHPADWAAAHANLDNSLGVA
jgi:hypothetical protein